MNQVPTDFADEREHRRKMADAINTLTRAVETLTASLAALEARVTALEP